MSEFNLKLSYTELQTIFNLIRDAHYETWQDLHYRRVPLYDEPRATVRLCMLEQLWKSISDEMGWDPP